MSGLRERLHRFWFHWHDDAEPDSRVGAGLGCGVTALDLDDAKRLIAAVALGNEPLPPISLVKSRGQPITPVRIWAGRR